MPGLTPITIPPLGAAFRALLARQRGRPGTGRPRERPASAGLAVRGVLAAVGAELRQVEPVGVVPPVLLGDVVAVLALRAGHSDLGAHVLRLAGHGAASSRVEASVFSRGRTTGTARATARARTVFQGTRPGP